MRKICIGVAVAFISSICVTCLAASPTMPVITGNGKSGPPDKSYKLVWSDEFNGKTLDETKWTYRGLGSRRDAVNAKDAVTLDGDGHLVINTIKVGDKIHCGMIATDGKVQWLYGYFECRAKMQKGIGDWSSFWMQSDGNAEDHDPKTFGDEIDIYEYFKHVGAGIIDHAVLWDGYGKKGHASGAIRRRVTNLDNGFHTFALDWSPTQYTFYVDGVKSWQTDKEISNHPEYILLSTEMLRSYGFKDSYAPDPVTFDYVRVYQRPSEGKQINSPAENSPH